MAANLLRPLSTNELLAPALALGQQMLTLLAQGRQALENHRSILIQDNLDAGLLVKEAPNALGPNGATRLTQAEFDAIRTLYNDLAKLGDFLDGRIPGTDLPTDLIARLRPMLAQGAR